MRRTDHRTVKTPEYKNVELLIRINKFIYKDFESNLCKTF